MTLVELVLLLLATVAVGGTLVRVLPLSLPIMLVVVGVGVSFLPPFSGLRVDPELFLLLFVPPILFADAWSLPRRDFVRTLRPYRRPTRSPRWPRRTSCRCRRVSCRS